MGLMNFFSDLDDEAREILKTKRQYSWKDFVNHCFDESLERKKMQAKKSLQTAISNVKDNLECPNCFGEVKIHEYETGRYFFVTHTTYYCPNELCDFAYGDLFNEQNKKW